MQIITIESEAYQNLLAKISQIENYIKNTTDLFADFEVHLELTSKDLMRTFSVSKSTLYRWRKNKVIAFRYDNSGNVMYSFTGLVLACKSEKLKINGFSKAELLMKLSSLKEEIIQNNLWANESNKTDL